MIRFNEMIPHNWTKPLIKFYKGIFILPIHAMLSKQLWLEGTSDQIRSVTQLCPTLCDPMNHSTSGLSVHHHLPEFTQTHVHRVGDAIQPSHPLSSPFPPAPNPSQYRGSLKNYHGILWARLPKWLAIPFSRGSSWPRDQPSSSASAGRFFTIWATREAQSYHLTQQSHSRAYTQRKA